MFPEAGSSRITGAPVKLSATPGGVKHPAPKLGADTRAALAELLGLDEETLEGLAKSGAI
jgi:CoA:oxalate CoA-transferase